MVFVLTEENTIANQFLFELRDKIIQQDRPRFRKNLERLGSIMAYEISRKLPFKPGEVQTPLGKSKLNTVEKQPVLITVLRAGLPFYTGFQDFFDHAESGFIGAYREETGGPVTIKLDYLATPGVEGKVVILIDPMLATGRSFVDSTNAMLKNGKPSHLHVASLVAAPEGIQYLKQNLKIPFTIWTFAIDEKLNDRFYIVPGLGDAGDLSFGEKL